MAELPTSLLTKNGFGLWLTEPTTSDRLLLHEEFNHVLAGGEGYPQSGPISFEEFVEYWIDGKRIVVAAWGGVGGDFVGSYFLKPNGYGRATHVANAGYFVAKRHRGNGAGQALVEHSMSLARSVGFDALQFNFVFESNPARRLYERLGFLEVGRVPRVIDGEDVLIYWRSL